MGDAQEAHKPLKAPDEDLAAPANIDMVNLSCQMTSMELLPEKDSVLDRKAKKRVRFSVPEGEDDTARKRDSMAGYRSRDVGEFLRAKRRFPRMCFCKISEIGEEHLQEKVKDDKMNGNDIDIEMTESEKPKFKYAKRRKQAEQTNVNCNCATKGKGRNSKSEIIRVNHTKGKSKSEECLSRHHDTKGKRKVVSKKTSVKDDTWCARYVLGDKRKVSDILKEFRALGIKEAKKRKVSSGHSKKKNRTDKLQRKHSSSVKQVRAKAGSKSKLKVKAYRAKLASANGKRAKERLKRAKAAKRKSLLKKANENRKKALKRKERLKRKLAQKRKASKKLSNMAKRRNVRGSRPRKVRIIPTWREEDVSENLRVNLLKFLTFEKAYESKYECCKCYCWDKWEELDIDDVIADFD